MGCRGSGPGSEPDVTSAARPFLTASWLDSCCGRTLINIVAFQFRNTRFGETVWVISPVVPILD